MNPRKITFSLLLLSLVCILPACNTVKGVGKDIHDSAQNVQTWIEDSDENRQQVASTPPNNQAAYRNRY